MSDSQKTNLKLVGIYRSPFVRRVAIALHYYGMPFELIKVSTQNGADQLMEVNKLARVPVLIKDSGETLVDSHFILEEIDRLNTSNLSLVPQAPELLKDYGQILANCCGALEKLVATFYELTRRPEDKVWQKWADQCSEQAIGGLVEEESRAPQSIIEGGYLFEDKLTHADIAAVIAHDYIKMLAQDRVKTPRLDALSARLNKQEPFILTSDIS